MRGVRTPHGATLRSRFLLPAGLLSVATLASLAMFFPGTEAGASGHADTAQSPAIPNVHVTTRSCGTVNVKGVTAHGPQRGKPVQEQLAVLPQRPPHLLRQPLHHLLQPAPVVHRRRPPPLRADVLELPRQRGQRGRSERPGRHRAEPARGRRRHGRLLGELGAHAGHGREGGRGGTAPDTADAPAGAGARGLGQLARPRRARRALSAPPGSRPVGGGRPLLPQLRRVPHDHRCR